MTELKIPLPASMITKALEGYYRLYDEQGAAFSKCMNHVLGNGRGQYLVFRASAGTGKTVTANAVIAYAAQFNIKITACAYTGRAAARMNAVTCHSLLYEPILDENGDLIRWGRKDPRAIRESVGDCIMVDEGSMIPQSMHQELSDIGVPIIYIGDDSQLDPVEPDKADNAQIFNVMVSLDADVVSMVNMRRFHPDSGIAKIGERLREDNVIRRINSDDVKFITKRNINVEFFKTNNVDVVICGSNATRKRLTRTYRCGNGWEWDAGPAIGERLMCLKNDVINNVRIYNGELYTVMFVTPTPNGYSRYMLYSEEADKSVNVDILDSTWEDETPPPNKRAGKSQKFGHFTFGYCMTAFKAQGSSFQNVLFYDEDVSFFTDQRKYRYTGITRAAKKLWVTI